MAYIYKITNDINDKVYIGQTRFPIQRRFYEHCYDATKYNAKHRPLYSAINKYGPEHFHIELIEETDQPMEREIYWIKYYDSYHNGYNATMGGEGRTQYDHNKIFELYSQGYMIKDICKILGCEETIVRKLLATKIPKEERSARVVEYTKKTRSKPVAKLDKDTEEILDVYYSLGEAGRQLKGVEKDMVHISQVCNGKRKTAYGHKWKFITREEFEQYVNKGKSK